MLKFKQQFNPKQTLSVLLIFTFLLIFVNSNEFQNKNIINSFIEVDQSQVRDGNKIQGKMQINGIDYNAICDCNPITPTNSIKPAEFEGGPKCDPSKLTIHSEKVGQGASHDDIRHLIGNIEELNYVKVPTFSFKCLDGRNRDAVLATPGGDSGEFIMALIVYEDLVGGGRKLNQDNIDLFFSQYLKMMPHPKFYMCTDDVSVAHLEKDLSVI